MRVLKKNFLMKLYPKYCQLHSSTILVFPFSIKFYKIQVWNILQTLECPFIFKIKIKFHYYFTSNVSSIRRSHSRYLNLSFCITSQSCIKIQFFPQFFQYNGLSTTTVFVQWLIEIGKGVHILFVFKAGNYPKKKLSSCINYCI